MSDEAEEQDCDCVAGLPPWMGTFADLMSLLMCFFVLLLSFSEMDAQKFKRLAGSLSQAFGVQTKIAVTDPPKGTSIIAREFSPAIPEPTPINEIFQKTEDITQSSLDFEKNREFDVEKGEENKDAGVAKASEAEVLEKIKEKIEELVEATKKDAADLAQGLRDQIVKGDVEVETYGRKIIIRIRERGSFRSGSATLSPDAYDVMEEIQSVLRKKSGSIQVQGHTDDIPINTARFRSNWELSTARAVSVAHALMEGDRLKETRFQVAGFAAVKPLVPNVSRAARAKNRRVEIVVSQDLDDDLDDEDKKLLQDQSGQDLLRDLDLNAVPYKFNLKPNEIF